MRKVVSTVVHLLCAAASAVMRAVNAASTSSVAAAHNLGLSVSCFSGFFSRSRSTAFLPVPFSGRISRSICCVELCLQYGLHGGRCALLEDLGCCLLQSFAAPVLLFGNPIEDPVALPSAFHGILDGFGVALPSVSFSASSTEVDVSPAASARDLFRVSRFRCT
ncbi:hypothetical protein SUGI_0597780 [Cryptomeria japonica]|nr:hypothetical protein SUGI_0597780 [Cryptomeria japonica]